MESKEEEMKTDLENNTLTFVTLKEHLRTYKKNEIISNDTLAGYFYQFGGGKVLNDAITSKLRGYIHVLKKAGVVVLLNRKSIMVVGNLNDELKSTSK